MVSMPIQLIQRYIGVTPVSISFPNSAVNSHCQELFEKYYYVSKQLSLTDIERVGLPFTTSTSMNDVIQSIKNGENKNQWIVFGMHGIDGSGWKDGTISSQFFQDILKYVQNENIYVGTQGDIGLYEYLSNSIELDVDRIGIDEIIITPLGFNSLRYPDDHPAIISICIPMKKQSKDINIITNNEEAIVLDGDKIMINFDLRKASYILLTQNNIFLY
jgi:hypothetical protein